ncbi:LOW QUALITY PROTEIN: hypothetical protein TorRG33x02_151190 [Trema orientale]|uniref:Uncharacterized protein n=1 Tax=Trema orientale TaxID=63057 RepID=A0A2P5EU36_TREOI|nr:LOW QUALITY PROTEIN: hypothetical protein TorRG33x02_151190 [Trema orientale]
MSFQFSQIIELCNFTGIPIQSIWCVA